MSEQIKIGFLYLGPPKSFIRNDLEIISRKYEVNILNLPANLRFILLFWRIIILAYKSDLIFSWFADIHTGIAVLLCRIFNKKLVVSVGGYDVARLPEINYGVFCYSPIRSLAAKITLSYADKILAVDQSLKNDAIKNAGVIGENIIVIPTGYDSEVFKSNREKENIIITVSSGDTWERVRLKGLDTFVEAAKLLPQYNFLVIGMQGDALKRLQNIASTNVEFIGPLSQKELILYYQKAKVYCQLSMREGLPNALCEAMLCECVPVGTRNGGIPTAIGDHGFYVPYGNQKAVAEAIEMALNSPKKCGKLARKRIIDNFKFEDRERKIFEIIGSLI